MPVPLKIHADSAGKGTGTLPERPGLARGRGPRRWPEAETGDGAKIISHEQKLHPK